MPRHDLQQFASKGGVHRTTEHHGRPAASNISKSNPEATPPIRKGGRTKAFQEETIKVALFLPLDLAGTLKAIAARRRLTPSLVVAEWIQKAETQETTARGQQTL